MKRQPPTLGLLLALLLSLPADANPLVEAFERLEAWGFSGAVAAGTGTEAGLLRGFGQADRSADLAFTADTAFPWLSVSKPLTAALALRLEADGIIRLDAPLQRLLDDVPGNKHDIQIRHLLSHQSGLAAQLAHPGFDGPPEFEPIDRDTLIDRALRSRPLHEPGQGFVYSNLGFNLAAALLSVAAETAFETLMREELLIPADLRGASVGGLAPDEAVGYDGGLRWGRFSERAWPRGIPGWNLMGAGALMGNMRDMAGIVPLLRGAAPMDEGLARRWREPQLRLSPEEAYGLGLAVSRDERGRRIGHDGGFGPFSTELAWWPGDDEWLLLASNSEHFRAWELRQTVVSLLARDRPIPAAPGEALPTVLQALPSGPVRISHPEGGHWQISRIDQRLEIVASGLAASLPLLGQDAEAASVHGRSVMDRVRGLLGDSRHRPSPADHREAAVMVRLREQAGARMTDGIEGMELLGVRPRLTGEDGWLADVQLHSAAQTTSVRIRLDANGQWRSLDWSPADPGLRAILRHAGDGHLKGLRMGVLKETAVLQVDENGRLHHGQAWTMPLLRPPAAL
ncbi:serine hydrolase domain-containing protein [Natronospira bacteriovora]|uniref:Serine hydrolase domain-containing protein n=1 Tax=Natronospira bacteriovora TaxID=3069753 RepID=A0ABU0W922_9GAMM|nr:serine hydrolase domain-containing protein [Natronospira sp. AB-CW4]MDQ2070506.1 serine hydrolase domain-containing protein [Natronospira sp. AB-CW4]